MILIYVLQKSITATCFIVIFAIENICKYKFYITYVQFSDFPVHFCGAIKKRLILKMQRSPLIFLIIVCLLVHSTVGITEMINSDDFYFPDQADYIKLATKCNANMILWPGNRRCYNEGEQGPCNVGRVLVFDRRLLKPYCKDLIF